MGTDPIELLLQGEERQGQTHMEKSHTKRGRAQARS